jgi:RNA polymerase sigma-70 factor (ECF subfamily)
MSTDLQLAFTDYVASWEHDAEGTLLDLQSLFLEEGACLARVEFLRAAAEKSPQKPAFSPARSAAEFAPEIQAISRVGLLPAYREGTLKAARLLALACDPCALWEVHRALLDLPLGKEKVGSSSPKHISEMETFWWAVRQAHDGDSAEVKAAQRVILERYRPAVYRYLLACLGDADAADDLCQEFSWRFVRGDFRNANPEKGRFRDLLKAALYHLIIDHHKRKQRAMPHLSPDAPEPEADSAGTLNSDRQFLDAWRADLLNKTWDALLQEEKRTGKPMHTVLHFRAEHPELRSAQMAEQLGARLNKRLSAEWVRKWLHGAREKFAELLLVEVSASLTNADPDTVEQELIDLDLHPYCKDALDKWRHRLADEE